MTMGIKRPLMILGSTVGAVATVLSYHPAASSTAASLATAPDLVETTPTPEATTSAPVATSSAAPTATSASTPQTTTKKNKTKNAKKSSATASSTNSTTDSSNTAAPSTSSSATPTPELPTAAPAPKVAKDQTVVGATAQTRWGPVQVQITVKNGKIVDAVGLQYPNGDRRSLWISEQAVPWLVEETLAEQIADVQIIGGATYTSRGWQQSLASAIQKAGL
ncbi:MAG: FMN-binding protein [Actinobacteria bacterium]|jgi:uncharacterized protein with FMN-binding domain|uniref:Unannotated protein n=1 Tax=freshwater metagenome TaxID=449393 RepID=A0A6J6D321_9ZZZZ|nr:FMN-binding protein [Actinomycetota bacterium]